MTLQSYTPAFEGGIQGLDAISSDPDVRMGSVLTLENERDGIYGGDRAYIPGCQENQPILIKFYKDKKIKLNRYKVLNIVYGGNIYLGLTNRVKSRQEVSLGGANF